MIFIIQAMSNIQVLVVLKHPSWQYNNSYQLSTLLRQLCACKTEQESEGCYWIISINKTFSKQKTIINVSSHSPAITRTFAPIIWRCPNSKRRLVAITYEDTASNSGTSDDRASNSGTSGDTPELLQV